MQKTGGVSFVPPKSEDKGQCDGFNEQYPLDFKLLMSETMGQAKRELSDSIYQQDNGIVIVGPPKKTNYSMEFSFLNAVFRESPIDELRKNASQAFVKHCKERDVNLALKNSRKSKNILYLLPLEFYYSDNTSFETGIKDIINQLTLDFSSFYEYRVAEQPNYDTYISFFFFKKLVILQFADKTLRFVDEIGIEKSSTFKKLLQYAEL